MDVSEPSPTEFQRTIELDADAETVLSALTDPSLLGQWLGEWRPEGDGAHLVTDDGVTRRVGRLERDSSSVRWQWAPDGDPDAASDVTIVVAPLDGGRSRLTVREVVAHGGPQRVASTAPAASASPAAAFAGWAVALLLLQVVVLLCGSRQLVAV